MAAGLAVQQVIIGVDPDRADTVRQHPLGLELPFNDGSVRRYIKAGAAIAIYDALINDFAEGQDNWQPSAVADTFPILGLAALALADNEFGWVIVKGNGFVKVAAAVAVGAVLVPIATAGTLDDTAATAANALCAAGGLGITTVLDDSPSAGIARVYIA